MKELLERINGLIWGIPALTGILGVGLYLCLKTGFVQFTMLKAALKRFWDMLTIPGKSSDGVSPMQALCTALAATVGTGNLVGVAGAICLGGPGAVFWMWVGGLLGMSTKFCEAMLAVRYRQRHGSEFAGGPMYYIVNGMGEKWRPMALVYAVFGVIAAFGVGNATQINAVVSSVNGIVNEWGRGESTAGNLLMGIALAALIGVLLMGGGKRIGEAAERTVPFASGAYILLCIVGLILGWRRIPQALASIVLGAWRPEAVTGGMVGSAFLALRTGLSRGVFTNEAGMGTAAIAHAGAQVDHPGQQGLMGIVEVFLDTIVICTMTALVILISGVPISYGTDGGGSLTTDAFCAVYGQWVRLFLAGAICCFAVATVLGWGLYGGRCAEFVFGKKGWKWFVLVQCITVVLGAVLDTGSVWLAAEIVNGLMSIPNLIALAWLAPELARLTMEYRQHLRNHEGRFAGKQMIRES